MIKKVLLFGFVVSLIISSYPIIAQENEDIRCAPNLDINVDLLAYETSGKPSKYQFPDFKEDTIIRIDSLLIKNNGKCDIPESRFSIKLIGPDGSNLGNLCTYVDGLYVPPLKISETYRLEQISPEASFEYQDNFGNIHNLCGSELDKLGKWKIEKVWYIPDYILRNYTSISGSSYSIRVNKSFLDEFNVLSRFNIQTLETQEQNLNFSRMAILIAIFVPSIILMSEILYREWRGYKKQENLLRSLFFELNLIKEDSEGYDKSLKFEGSKMYLPNYDIKELEAGFYSKNLNSSIEFRNTHTLKAELFKIYDKTRMVNREIEKLRHIGFYYSKMNIFEMAEYSESKIRNLKEIKKDLDKHIKNAKSILKKNFNIK